MVQMTAREVGRNLELTLGEAPADGEHDDRIRIVVPPVTAKVGASLFAQFNTILFARAPIDPEQVAEQATRMALGAWIDPDDEVTDEQRKVATDRWDAVQELRWAESELVCQAALYWNAQGGGLDIVNALLDPTTEVDASGGTAGRAASSVPPAAAAVGTLDGVLTTDDVAQFGVGEPDPVTGRYPRYVYPRWYLEERAAARRRRLEAAGAPLPETLQEGATRAPGAAPAPSRVDPLDVWRLAFTEWDRVTAPDLLSEYGVDMDQAAAWSRSWGSLVGLILGLLDVADSRLTRRVRAMHDPPADGAPSGGASG